MLEEDRACEQMLTQLMAVRAGIDQVGLLLMETHIEKCLLKDLTGRPGAPAGAAGDVEDVGALRPGARRGAPLGSGRGPSA